MGWIGLWLVAAASAGFPGERWNESVVVGANLTVALGEVEGSRLGAGIDLGYELQWYTQEAGRYDGDYRVWAEEHPAHSYGPTAHLWWVDGAWTSTLGARYGVTWPLRVGIGRGWWPGPGVAAELGVAVSTSGVGGLDGQLVLDAPWVRGRVGATVGGAGFGNRRLHVGGFTPVLQPENWEHENAWQEPAGR